MLFLTHYKEYPIYEPAEGGYYYTGVEMLSSRRVPNLEKGLKRLAKIGEEYGFTRRGERRYIYPDSSVNPSRPSGTYIGDGEYLCIESKQGCDVSGLQPYQ